MSVYRTILMFVSWEDETSSTNKQKLHITVAQRNRSPLDTHYNKSVQKSHRHSQIRSQVQKKQVTGNVRKY